MTASRHGGASRGSAQAACRVLIAGAGFVLTGCASSRHDSPAEADAGPARDSRPSSTAADASTSLRAGDDADAMGFAGCKSRSGCTIDRADAASVRDARLRSDGASMVDASPEATWTRDAHAGKDVAQPQVDAEAGVDAGSAVLRYIGRTLTDGTSPDGYLSCTSESPCFEWSGTQVIARFNGATSFHVTMSDYGSYFDVYIDGVLQSTPILGDPSQTDYAVATNLDAAMTHEVSLYKRTEASANGRTMIMACTFPGGGTLLPPAEAASRRIEVVGDSVSCGYGVLGPSATCTETSAYEDHDVTYEAITARTLNADLYTIASSGRGMYENIDGTTTGTLPDIYGFTVPYVSQGEPSAWDFASWTPDVVVVELGANDFLSAGDPGQPFVSAYVAFLGRVRENYPSAWIFCTNGPLLSGTEYAQAQVYIASAVTTFDDPKVVVLAFPSQEAANGEGCGGHPSIATQQMMASQLTASIASALAW